MAGKVAVIGSTNWDICMYLPHLPAPGETVGSGRLQTNLGGKGANQAIACHKAGSTTKFISCLGDDATATQIFDTMNDLGLDTSSIRHIKNCSTGTATIFIDANGENCIGLTAGANAKLSADIVEQHAETITSAAVVLLQLEIPIESVVIAAKLASDSSGLVVLNPAPAAKLPAELYTYIDVLTPNRGELGYLTEMATDTDDELIAAAHCILGKGARRVLVTLGRDGALLVSQDKHQFFPPFIVEAKDSTGAGDCFNGYLAAGIAKLGIERIDEVIQVAMAAAAVSVTRDGATAAMPDINEVELFIQSKDTETGSTKP